MIHPYKCLTFSYATLHIDCAWADGVLYVCDLYMLLNARFKVVALVAVTRYCQRRWPSLSLAPFSEHLKSTNKCVRVRTFSNKIEVRTNWGSFLVASGRVQSSKICQMAPLENDNDYCPSTSNIFCILHTL